MNFSTQPNNLGERIRLHRVQTGMTVAQLAKQIESGGKGELSVKMIRQYEADQVEIPANALKVIADSLGIDMGSFFQPLHHQMVADIQTVHLVQAFSKIRRRDSKDAVIHLARLLAKVSK